MVVRATWFNILHIQSKYGNRTIVIVSLQRLHPISNRHLNQGHQLATGAVNLTYMRLCYNVTLGAQACHASKLHTLSCGNTSSVSHNQTQFQTTLSLAGQATLLANAQLVHTVRRHPPPVHKTLIAKAPLLSSTPGPRDIGFGVVHAVTHDM